VRRLSIATAVILIPAALAVIPAGGQGTTGSSSDDARSRSALPFAHATETRIPTRADVYARMRDAMMNEITAFREECARLARALLRTVACARLARPAGPHCRRPVRADAGHARPWPGADRGSSPP
jgi:hypothetical protein